MTRFQDCATCITGCSTQRTGASSGSSGLTTHFNQPRPHNLRDLRTSIKAQRELASGSISLHLFHPSYPTTEHYIAPLSITTYRRCQNSLLFFNMGLGFFHSQKDKMSKNARRISQNPHQHQRHPQKSRHLRPIRAE